MSRDEFNKSVKSLVSERAGYFCSMCKVFTLSASRNDPNKSVKIGIVAHITAASEGGPRYDKTLTSQQRKSTKNAIYLCENHASEIDKNKGIDFTVDELKSLKLAHEEWVRGNLNMSLHRGSLKVLDVSAHLEAKEFPTIDIKILNEQASTTFLTKGKVTTIDRFIIPNDSDGMYRQISWTYDVHVSPGVGEHVLFDMSQSIEPNSAERFAISVRGDYPHDHAASMNLYQLRFEFYEGEDKKIQLPDVIVHIPRDGKVLAMTRFPYTREQYNELVRTIASSSRDVLERLTSSIESGAKLCCDYDVAQGLIENSQVDQKIKT